jgi:selenide,water dikinase
LSSIGPRRLLAIQGDYSSAKQHPRNYIHNNIFSRRRNNMTSMAVDKNKIGSHGGDTRDLSTCQTPLDSCANDNIGTGSNNDLKRIVLIGGGHAHLQLIKAYNFKARPSNWHVTLIDKTRSATYSGMIPGCIANFYTPRETQIPLDELAQWAKVEYYHDTVVGIDLDNQVVKLKDHEEGIQYDVASIDIGSTSRGLDLVPGVLQYAIPTRPIDLLVKRIQQAADKVSAQDEVKVVVVGGGASGVELAMCMRARFGPLVCDDDHLQVTILDSGSELLPYESSACHKALRDVLQEKNIHVRHNCRVQSIENDVIQLEDDCAVPYTHCIWATGAAPHSSLVNELKLAGLSTDEHGWIEVGPTLQSISHENVFAAGDCVTIQGLVDPVTGRERATPSKAGVYAVRTGPILIENISRYLSNQNLINYSPQDDFLKLLMCGDGTALGFRFGLPLRGKWVWQLKNAIDCMFMDLFQVKNLPKLDETEDKSVEGNYDTSQYDEYVRKDNRMSPKDGAHLIMRTDDDVDYKKAWEVLRDMMVDEEYKHQVLSYIVS